MRGVVLLLWGVSSSAWARHRVVSDGDEYQRGFAIELIGARLGNLAPDVSNVVFSTSGTLNGRPQTFTGDGRSNGFERPSLNELALDFVNVRFLRWFCVGAFFVLAQGDGDIPTQFSAIGGGLHTGLVWTAGYWDLRADVDIGLRGIGFETYALDTETCTSKGGATFPCQPVASTLQQFLQPRLRLGVNVGGWVTLGGFAGLDLARGIGWEAGGFATIHSPSWVPAKVRG
jgi:hypothetical protein